MAQLATDERTKSHAFLLYSVSAFTVLLLIKILFDKVVSSRRQLRLPPSPPGALPIVGHLHLLRPPIHQALHRLNDAYGPLIYVRAGSTPLVCASTPEVARELFKAHDTAISNRPQTVASRHFAYGSAGFAFAPYGPYWRFMKRLCMTELLGSRTVDQLRPVRRSELMDMVSSMLDSARARAAVNLSWELVKLANNEVTKMAASTTSSAAGGETEEARELVKQVAELVGAFNLSDFIGVCRNFDLQGLNKRISGVHDRFDALLEKIIQGKEKARKTNGEEEQEEKKNEGVKDLLDILLDVAKDDKAELKLTRENIKGFIMDVFTAGSDSTAATIEWAMAELINDPMVLQKLREEIDRVVGKHRIVEESDISSLVYLQAVTKETMRLHPAATISHRQNAEDITVAGYDIPAHTSIFVNLWSIGRDPNYWENPEEFRPERFASRGDEQVQGAVFDVKGQHYQLLPFGSGRRGCPGMTLAWQVVNVTVAALVQCFDWEIAAGNGEGKGKLDMEEGIGLVIAKAEPLILVPVPRLDPFPSIQ